MHNEIYRIAYQLNAQGKKPSVALIRSRLSTPTSLPIIVQALQQWKHSPELGKEEDERNGPQTDDFADDQSNIEKRLAALEQKMDRILALLENSR